jgi:hypothetical protein
VYVVRLLQQVIDVQEKLIFLIVFLTMAIVAVSAGHLVAGLACKEVAISCLRNGSSYNNCHCVQLLTADQKGGS